MGRKPNRAVDVEARDRADTALKLRLRGMTFREIGSKLGISGAQANIIVTRELERRRNEPSEDTELLRQQEVERMTDLIARLNARMDRVSEDEDGADTGPSDSAYAQLSSQLMRASERLAKLLGLDAPVRTESETTVTVAGDQSAVAAVLGAPVAPHEE